MQNQKKTTPDLGVTRKLHYHRDCYILYSMCKLFLRILLNRFFGIFSDVFRSSMRSPLLLACFVGLWTTVISLKICAFNIQTYGEAKASNKRVMEILIKVQTTDRCIRTPTCCHNVSLFKSYRCFWSAILFPDNFTLWSEFNSGGSRF